jgi:hypothetical protein
MFSIYIEDKASFGRQCMQPSNGFLYLVNSIGLSLGVRKVINI